jgi:hypothetical protein
MLARKSPAPALIRRFVLGCLGLVGCDGLTPAPPLSKRARELSVGDQIPAVTEREAIGRVEAPVTRRGAKFRALRVSDSRQIVFKDEEATGADRVMTPRLEVKLEQLGRSVRGEWDGVRLRVTEAWDEDAEHGPLSAHYEGRAADLTTSDLDPKKLGRLAYLAVEAGFDWVYFESSTHVHASVRK